MLLYADSSAQSAASDVRDTQNRSVQGGPLKVKCSQLMLSVAYRRYADHQQQMHKSRNAQSEHVYVWLHVLRV